MLVSESYFQRLLSRWLFNLANWIIIFKENLSWCLLYLDWHVPYAYLLWDQDVYITLLLITWWNITPHLFKLMMLHLFL